ncbi:MAG TPA: hypothetical protein VMF86_13825 [Stellaceae bacterium]|nr:hypothetical protein [Stellaceae bacterium]
MAGSMPSRRGLIAGVLGAALYPAGSAQPAAAAAAETGHAALAALCAGLPAAGTIGRACLRALPADVATPERLARLILADLPAVSGRASARVLARAIRERSRADFRDGRIVSVDGWMLSLAEARLYALATLLPRRGA